MRKPFFMALTGLALVGCGPADDGGGGVDAAPPINPCQLFADPENKPGGPFDFNDFQTNIYPDLQSGCSTASACHGVPSNNNFTTFVGGNCPEIQTFNSMVPLVDYKVNVANSVFLANMDGTDAHLGGNYAQTNPALLEKVRSFLQKAFDNATGGDTGDITNNFDKAIFETQIQPALDNAGCIIDGCHGLNNPARNFGLNPRPAAGSAEMEANFKDVASYVDLNLGRASDTVLFKRSTDGHTGPRLNDVGADALEAWIQEALDASGPGDISTCVPEAKFNIGVFEDEIMPFLKGDVDYNDLDGGRTTTGCARSECHGRDRGAGTFYIDPFRSVEENIDNFRCFIDVTNPSASQVLICPLNLNGCQKKPHPGGDIFFGIDDLNYQKMLGFIYATENGATPLDFAFFVRKINPLFNDENAVQDGQLGLTCASSGCHNAPNGRDPDNGSNFGIIAEATDQQDLFLNFISAANFTLFNDATQSSLFLYPTNEIANQNNPLATGFDHPGGECFAVNDPEALDILKFSGGIRPNGQGFLQDFLVAGLFPATDVTDDAPFDEDAVTPKIFDRSGQSGQFNQGQWDLFAAADENIDFLDFFNVADAEEQFAVAVAYVINTTTRELDTVITVASENDVVLRVGADPDPVQEAIGRDGVGATITTTLPAFSDTKKSTRIMVKAFQKVGDVGLAFTMAFADDNGNILTDATKELVFTLSGEQGGI